MSAETTNRERFPLFIEDDVALVLQIFHRLLDDLDQEHARSAATLTLAVCMLEAGSRAGEK
jgi:hypothetical protein